MAPNLVSLEDACGSFAGAGNVFWRNDASQGSECAEECGHVVSETDDRNRIWASIDRAQEISECAEDDGASPDGGAVIAESVDEDKGFSVSSRPKKRAELVMDWMRD